MTYLNVKNITKKTLLQLLDEMSAESEEEELGYSNIAYTKIYLKHITKT